MKTSFCIALVSAGLFSAQMTFAQSPTAAPQQVGAATTAAPVCPELNMDCLAKSLALTPDQVTRMTAINRQYASECATISASKATNAVLTQKIAEVQKKRDTELRAILSREQSGKWDSAVASCTKPKPAVQPTTASPAGK